MKKIVLLVVATFAISTAAIAGKPEGAGKPGDDGGGPGACIGGVCFGPPGR